MTRHLSPDELVDLADGTRAESSAAHLRDCERCRRQVADLRVALRAAASVDVPEPSPLFWDHFSARVGDAVRAEGALQPRRRADVLVMPRLGLPLWAGVVAALVIAAVIGVRLLAPAPAPPSASLAVQPMLPSTVTVPADGALTDDPTLGLVADLAQEAEMDWESAGEAGLTIHPGATDKVVADLDAGERRELQRLLKEELSTPDGNPDDGAGR